MKHISTFHHMQNFTSGMIHPHSLGSFVQLPWPEYFFPTWTQKTLSKQFCVQVWVHERAFIPHTEEPTFCYTFYYDEVAAFHTTWPGFNDRAGEEAAPQTFRFIIHQPTALTTNNYILVGGGGWGSVALCSVNTHTPSQKKNHLNELATSKWHNQIQPEYFEVIFSPASQLKWQHLEWIIASKGGKWEAL